MESFMVMPVRLCCGMPGRILQGMNRRLIITVNVNEKSCSCKRAGSVAQPTKNPLLLNCRSLTKNRCLLTLQSSAAFLPLNLPHKTTVMKKTLPLLIALQLLALVLYAQVEPSAGSWKTWLISSGRDYRLPQPSSYKPEIAEVLTRQRNLDSAGRQQILYWNAGAPGYRWQEMMNKLWTVDTGSSGVLANMLLGTGIYDATVAAWDTKYAHKRSRPFEADSRIRLLVPNPGSPSYPCEHSVAAGVASTIIAHFYPRLADSVRSMAQRLMDSRIAAGVAFPSDARAGFELGKKIAEQCIAKTRGYVPSGYWDGKMPQGAGLWRGKKPMHPMAGASRTMVLDSSSQFRPGPPPDFAKDMEELRNHKPTFRSVANAYIFASTNFWEDLLNKKIFEHNLHLNPPKAARIYALTAVGAYDGFAACWDAKYAYWGIRPEQYDTTFKPVLFQSPPFPGYPSGHAMMGAVFAKLYSAFFPADAAYFEQKAKDGAESRFQGGIHFRSDNDAGLELGRNVASAILKKARSDGFRNE
jgi:membrane-associated phospholipid phosphatase